MKKERYSLITEAGIRDLISKGKTFTIELFLTDASTKANSIYWLKVVYKGEEFEVIKQNLSRGIERKEFKTMSGAISFYQKYAEYFVETDEEKYDYIRLKIKR